MSKTEADGQKTFLVRAFRLFKERIRGQFTRVESWRRDATESVNDFFGSITKWMLEHKMVAVIGLAVIVWVALMIWFIADVLRGQVQGSAVQVGVGGIIGGAIIGFIISPIAAGIAFVSLLLLNWSFKILTAAVLFVPVILWTPVYGIWRGVLVTGQLLLLIPLSALFIVTRGVQLWRGIFWTCPARQCAYRGLPAHVCPECGEVHDRLWPNLYGVFWHHCSKCGHRLPTLSSLGRNALERRCGDPNCRMPLLGMHAGKAPERLVAIVGAPSSGKTNYLLMAVRQIVDGCGSDRSLIKGIIDDKGQEAQFSREWTLLERGQTPDATSAVPTAFLLYVRTGQSKNQLYLYDAPGEEFTTLAGISNQQYFHLLEGIILLVDPMSFSGFNKAGGEIHQRKTASLQEVVASVASHAAAVVRNDSSRKLYLKVAVVISKADLPGVKAFVGDVTKAVVTGARCREVIVEWGGTNAIQALENRFQSVEYFACSALGRDPNTESSDSFRGFGVLEPLRWTLTGER